MDVMLSWSDQVSGVFTFFFAEKQSHWHHCLNMSWLGCVMLMGFGSRWWWQSTKDIASLKHSTRKDAFPKGNFTFQPAFFWCYVSFRECIKSIGPYQISPGHGRKMLPQNDGSWHCDLGWKWSKTWLTKHKRDEFLAGMEDFSGWMLKFALGQAKTEASSYLEWNFQCPPGLLDLDEFNSILQLLPQN